VIRLIGDKIVELREEKGFTQVDFAKLLDINRVTLHRYEKNERTPDMNFLVKLSKMFNVSLDEFVLEKSNIADRIREMMEIKQITAYDLVEKTGIAVGNIYNYMRGRYTPNPANLKLIAQALGVFEAWLMGDDVPINGEEYINNTFELSKGLELLHETRKIPILGKIACGEPVFAEENIEGYTELDNRYKADFALICKGDSMINARIFHGDIVYIRSQPSVENGEIAAVLIGEETTLKRVYKYPSRIELRPENPIFEVLNYEGKEMNDIRIIGKAVSFLSNII